MIFVSYLEKHVRQVAGEHAEGRVRSVILGGCGIACEADGHSFLRDFHQAAIAQGRFSNLDRISGSPYQFEWPGNESRGPGEIALVFSVPYPQGAQGDHLSLITTYSAERFAKGDIDEAVLRANVRSIKVSRALTPGSPMRHNITQFAPAEISRVTAHHFSEPLFRTYRRREVEHSNNLEHLFQE